MFEEIILQIQNYFENIKEYCFENVEDYFTINIDWNMNISCELNYHDCYILDLFSFKTPILVDKKQENL
jgi:hypothetical protein